MEPVVVFARPTTGAEIPPRRGGSGSKTQTTTDWHTPDQRGLIGALEHVSEPHQINRLPVPFALSDFVGNGTGRGHPLRRGGKAEGLVRLLLVPERNTGVVVAAVHLLPV